MIALEPDQFIQLLRTRTRGRNTFSFQFIFDIGLGLGTELAQINLQIAFIQHYIYLSTEYRKKI